MEERQMVLGIEQHAREKVHNEGTQTLTKLGKTIWRSLGNRMLIHLDC